MLSTPLSVHIFHRVYSIGIPDKYKDMKVYHYEDTDTAITHGATGKQLLKYRLDVKVK